MLFYVLAPATRLIGASGAVSSVFVLNGAGFAAAAVMAWKAAGRALGLLAVVGALALMNALGPGALGNPWNPVVPLSALFVLVPLAHCAAVGRWGVLPWMAVVGSFAVQAHLGYGVVVLGLFVVTFAFVLADARAAADWRRLRRWGVWSLFAAGLSWLPTAIEQLTTSPGNLTLLSRYLRSPGEPAAGWSVAWQVFGNQLGFPQAWLARRTYLPGEVGASPLVASAAVLAAVLSAVIVHRRGERSATRLSAIVLFAVGSGFVATARVTGPVYDYVVRFWWVISVWLVVVLCWNGWLLVRHHFRTFARRVFEIGGAACAAGLAVVLLTRVLPPPLPESQAGTTLRVVADALENRLRPEARYLVNWADRRTWGGFGMGLVVELINRRFDVYVSPDWTLVFGNELVSSRQATDGTILVVSEDDEAAGYRAPDDALLVARVDPLSPGDRARVDELRDLVATTAPEVDVSLADSALGRIQLVEHGVPAQLAEELGSLRRAGSAYAVYLNDRES